MLVPLALAAAPPAGPGAGNSPEGTIEALVQAALDNNPGLKAERSKIRALREVPSQARALPDPMADVELMNLSVRHPSLGDAFGSDISVGITQALPFPGKRALAGKAAEEEAAAEEARLKTMESGLRAEVIGAAFRFATARELLAINGQTQEALKAAAQSAAAVYASGQGSQSDILLAQTALTRTQAEQMDLDRQREIALAKLSSLLAGPPPEGSIEGLPIPEPGPLPPLDDLLEAVSDASPAVLAARAEVTVSEAKVQVAKRAFKPDFLVGGRYRWKDTTMGGGDYVTAMAGISLPFFHRKDRYEPALQEAVLMRENANYGADDAVNAARYDLMEAYQTATRNAKVFALYKEGLLLQARGAFQSALSAYGVGKVDFASVLISLRDLYGYEAEAVMAQGDFQDAMARIEALAGRPLAGSDPTLSNSPSLPSSTPEEARP